jgi:hypothetical protein
MSGKVTPRCATKIWILTWIQVQELLGTGLEGSVG